MSIKGSHEWYKQVGKEWDRYVGDRATVREYAEGGEPYVTRLRQDLKKWWGDHPDPAITPPETVEQFRSIWMTFSNNQIPEDLPRGTPMRKQSAMSNHENEKDLNLDS